MRILSLLFLAAVLAAGDVVGQSMVLKDGRVVPFSNLRRQAENVIATVQFPPQNGQPATTGDASFPAASIERLDFPVPANLAKVPDLVAQGKGKEALALVEPLVTYLAGFQEIPGSRWDEAALTMAQVLAAEGRAKESQDLANRVSDLATAPEMKTAAKMQVAAMFLERGDRYQALTLVEPVLKNLEMDNPRAGAFLVKGQCLLEDEKWEPALMAFLQVPVFYPGEKLLMPDALLGRARAHLGLDDFAAARSTLQELAKSYPGTRAGKLVPAELEKVARREKGVNEAK